MSDTFDNRFGGSSGGNITPEQLRLMLLKRSLAPSGFGINSTPIVPTPVQSVPVATTDPVPTRAVTGTGLPGDTPYRTPTPDAVDKWRSGVAQDMSTGVIPTSPDVPATPIRPIPPMPRQAEPVPYAPPGVSLTSTPNATPAPGWAGTVGISSPEESKAFDKGTDWGKAMSGLEEMAKAASPKAPQVQIPNLLLGAPEPNQANQMASQLMTAMLNKPRGLTLTGR
jgi:hypothetical protein